MLAKTSFALGLSASFFALGANGWLLEFWSGQADCNYKIREGGVKEAADTSRGGLDHESNNCMMMSYDPTGDGILAMKATGWTPDCAIALWSDKSGSSPCDSEMPYDPYGNPPRKPDHIFTLKSPEAFLSPDEAGNSYACITPLNTYVQSNSGFLGYISYSCGGNGTLLSEMDKNPSLTPDEIKSLIKSISSSATASPTTTLPTGVTSTDAPAPTGNPGNVTLVTSVITTRKSTLTTVITKKLGSATFVRALKPTTTA
jgi:hypothetical protein